MAKLVVNIADGTIEIEGDEAFVLAAFAEVQTALSALNTTVLTGSRAKSAAPELNGTSPDDATPKNKSTAGKSKPSKKPQPTLNSSLDLSGLSEFLNKYKPKNNAEKILVFGAFLRDTQKIVPCSFDDIFSCFYSMKSSMKIPQAFAKNMHDAKISGYIDYVKLNEISIPTMGENHLTVLLKKAAE
ncbi:hypothetical protein D3C72_1013340 [compost metagenome]